VCPHAADCCIRWALQLSRRLTASSSDALTASGLTLPEAEEQCTAVPMTCLLRLASSPFGKPLRTNERHIKLRAATCGSTRQLTAAPAQSSHEPPSSRRGCLSGTASAQLVGTSVIASDEKERSLGSLPHRGGPEVRDWTAPGSWRTDWIAGSPAFIGAPLITATVSNLLRGQLRSLARPGPAPVLRFCAGRWPASPAPGEHPAADLWGSRGGGGSRA
jgi:hypothetical protein